MSSERRKIHLNRSITWAVIRVFWQHLRRYPLGALLVLTGTIALGILQVVTPWLYKLFFDALAYNTILREDLVLRLFTILLWILGLKILAWLLRRLKGLSSIYVQSRVMRDLTQTSLHKLLEHSYRFFTDNFSGSLVRKVNRLARSFEEVADQVEFSLIPLLVTTAGILWVIFGRHPLLGTVLLSGVLSFFFLNIIIAAWKQKYDLGRAEKDSEATGVLADALSNAISIKVFSRYEYEESLYKKVTDGLHRLRSFTWKLNEWIDAGQGATMIAIEFIMLYVAINLWQKGVLTVGDFVLIQIYLLNLFDRLWEFGRVLRRTYEGVADAAEMVEILNLPNEIKDRPDAVRLQVDSGKIEFRDVHFNFPSSRKVFKQFNLVINPGEKVALVGPSGAGKTTVVKLLLRLYDINKGEIRIDGQNISAVTQNSLREQIAFVPQEPILFHRTLRENILYGRMNASEEEIVAAAKKAHCHEFISKLPHGYDTYVGERGIKLSGGERQRLTIARAILKNAPILILDEATSSLDSQSEALIQEALEQLMEKKTAVAIAHRLSTIMKMDRILVIDKGRIITAGTHKTLLKKEGVYRKLWEIQAGGFLG